MGGEQWGQLGREGVLGLTPMREGGSSEACQGHGVAGGIVWGL